MASKAQKTVIQKTKGRITPEQELHTSAIISKLGDSPAYAHTYERFMKAGTKVATEMFDRAVGRYVRIVKNIMSEQIANLQKREKELYSFLKIDNFNQFEAVWLKLTQLQKGANGLTLDKAINYLAQLEQAAMKLIVDKNFSSDIGQANLKIMQNAIAELKPFFHEKSPAQAILNDPKFQFGTDEQGNIVALNTTSINLGMKQQIGNLAEEIFIPNLIDQKEEEILQALGGLDKIAVKRVGGERKEGSKDVMFAFTGLDEKTNKTITLNVGITVKARSAFFDGKLENRFGGKISARNFDTAFYTSNELAYPISSEIDSLLKYLLTNRSMFVRKASISNEQLFEQDVKLLLIYGYAIFGVLGEGWKNVPDLVPLFYFSNGRLYQTRAILQLLKDSSDVTVYANKKYGQ